MDPPEPSLSLFAALVPALVAVTFSAMTHGLGAIPASRQAALHESLSGARKRALGRYLEHPLQTQLRWLVLRVLGIASSAALISQVLPEEHPLVTIGLVLVVYALPAAIASALVRRSAETVAPWLLAILRPFELVVAPLAAPMFLLGKLISGKTVDRPRASLVESEVELLVNQGEQSGSLAHDQSEMIRNVLDFGEVCAGDVMVPRTQVTAVEVSTSLDKVLQLISEKGHSRFPVYRDTIDNVIGILHVKDVVARVQELDQLKVTDLMRQTVIYVPETQPASGVLKDMRSGRRQHLAIVIDEFGGMCGIVTLEDLLEEIVGDIRDEYDGEEPQVVDLGNGKFLVDASVTVADVSRHLGVELPEEGDYYSIGGFIVEELGRVPRKGDVLNRAGLDFVIKDADERHVVKIEIVRGPDTVPRSSSRPAA